MNVNLSNLTAAQLRQAAALKERLEALQTQLTRLLGDSAAASSVKAAAPKKKGVISPAGLARIRAAQKARWAKLKAAKPAAPAKKKKFTMSPAAKAAISRAAKARWARIKAEQA